MLDNMRYDVKYGNLYILSNKILSFKDYYYQNKYVVDKVIEYENGNELKRSNSSLGYMKVAESDNTYKQ